MMNKDYFKYPSHKEMVETLNVLSDNSLEPNQRIRRALCRKRSETLPLCEGCFFNRVNHKDGLPCSVTLGIFGVNKFETIKMNVLKYFRQSGILFEDIKVKRFRKVRRK